jgi:hypothetical protein
LLNEGVLIDNAALHHEHHRRTAVMSFIGSHRAR